MAQLNCQNDSFYIKIYIHVHISHENLSDRRWQKQQFSKTASNKLIWVWWKKSCHVNVTLIRKYKTKVWRRWFDEKNHIITYIGLSKSEKSWKTIWRKTCEYHSETKQKAVGQMISRKKTFKRGKPMSLPKNCRLVCRFHEKNWRNKRERRRCWRRQRL